MRRGWKWVLLKSKEWVFNADGWHWGPEWSALHNCSHKPAMVHWLCNFEKIWEKSLHSFTRSWGMMIHGWEKAQRFGWAIKTSGLWINCFENRELFWLWSRAALWRCCHATFILSLENQQLQNSHGQWSIKVLAFAYGFSTVWFLRKALRHSWGLVNPVVNLATGYLENSKHIKTINCFAGSKTIWKMDLRIWLSIIKL